jgi:hypothetical protein
MTVDRDYLFVYWDNVPGAERYEVTLTDRCDGDDPRSVSLIAMADHLEIRPAALGVPWGFVTIRSFQCGEYGARSACTPYAMGPLPVVDRLTAVAELGAVTIEWTVREIEAVAGFHLYRRTEGGRLEERITREPIERDGAEYRVTDETVSDPGVYRYRLSAIHALGSERTLGEARVEVPRVVVAPTLVAPAPNPRAEGGRFIVVLPREGDIDLDILDAAGRHVRRLASGRVSRGRHEFTWDARADGERAVAAGRYFVRLLVDGTSTVFPLTLLP